MFTGIVEELGTVAAIEEQGDAIRLSIAASTVLAGVALGDSIAVNGCCLTVATLGPPDSPDSSEPTARTEATASTEATATWTADVMQETLTKTSLRGIAPGDVVNLERAVTPQTRLGGHIVQGHVDGVGEILARTPSEHWEIVEISLPERLARYLVDKGSVAVDGISLTVVEAGDASFTVSLIPETLARTTLGRRRVGDRVNLEVDVLAKHVERLLAASGLDTSSLVPRDDYSTNDAGDPTSDSGASTNDTGASTNDSGASTSERGPVVGRVASASERIETPEATA